MVAIVTLTVGLTVAAVGVAVVAGFLGRVHEAMGSVERFGSLDGYPSRPAEVAWTQGVPHDVILLAEDASQALVAGVVLHLSATGDDLSLVVVSPDMRVPDSAAPPTLANVFAVNPTRAAHSLEQLFGVRSEHQLVVRIDEVSQLAATFDGLAVDDLAPADRLQAHDVPAYLAGGDAGGDTAATAERVGSLVRAVLQRITVREAVLNPSGFDKAISQLIAASEVDEDFTEADLQSALMDMRFQPTVAKPIVLGSDQQACDKGREPDSVQLSELRQALATDDFTGVG
jgi:hypothetical protein